MDVRRYLAFKYITRNKIGTFILVLGISVVLMMSIIIKLVATNTLNQQIIDAKIKYGNWHLAYKLNDENIIRTLEQENYIELASLIYCLQPMEIKNDEFSLDLSLIQKDKYQIMVEELVLGVLPKESNEIIVEDWFLEKNNIKSIPYNLIAGGIEFKITGAYHSRVSNNSKKAVKAYGSIEKNIKLIKSELLSDVPSNTNYLMQLNDKKIFKKKTSFVFIRLKPNVRIDNAVYNLEQYTEILEFNQIDSIIKRTNNNSMPLYNINLINAENRDGVINYNKNTDFSIQQKALLINLLLFFILFVMIFVLFNIVVNKNISILGIIYTIGLEPKQIIYIHIIHALIITVVSIPLGTILGIIGTRLFLTLTIGQLNGDVIIASADILINIVVSVLSVLFAAVYPAVRASKLTPINALTIRNSVCKHKKNNSSSYIKLGIIKGKTAFPFIYSFKNAISNTNRFLGIILIIASLLTLYINFSKQIETVWKTGDWRQSYKSDYEIKIPYISSERIVNINVKPVDNSFKKEISKINGIKNIYYQHSIIDNVSIKKNKNINIYNYFFYLADNQVNKQAKKVFEMSCPIKRVGYPQNINFIYAGISGYEEKELEFAKKYLIEGNIDISKMSSQPIILLPKYINWFENMNIPYTSLKVGDNIKLIENDIYNLNDFNIKNEYTFTIGGFVDRLPFKQINGVSNGFVAIMHSKQLKKLSTEYKGIMNIYIDVNEDFDHQTLQKIKELCYNYGYSIYTNKDNFVHNKIQKQMRKNQHVLYLIFGILGIVVFLVLFNMILSSTFTRKSEFALLHTIGMSKLQITITILFEYFLYGLIGSLLGCLGGITLILLSKLNGGLLTFSQIIPSIHILIGVLLIISACIISTSIGLFQILKRISIHDIIH